MDFLACLSVHTFVLCMQGHILIFPSADASGNLAPVRELPEEPDLPSALNEGESIRHLTTALVHPSMNGTGANQCEELHSNE